MIDFRYHLVSIVAVFLALTVGLVLGTTMLQDPLLHTMKSETSELRGHNEELRGEKDAADRIGAGGDELAGAYAHRIAADLLADVDVVVIEAPGADESVTEALSGRVAQAGGAVVGRLALTGKFVDTEQATFVDELAAQLAEEPRSPGAGPYDRAGAQIARALVRDDPEPAPDEWPEDGAAPDGEQDAAGEAVDYDAEAVLAGFSEGGLLEVHGEPAGRVDAAIVVAPAEPFSAPADTGAGTRASEANAAVIALARALHEETGGVVLTGGASALEEQGMLAQARGVGPSFSTVDVAGRPLGDLLVVLALAASLDGFDGAYGIGEGVDGFVPDPLPEPRWREPEEEDADGPGSEREAGLPSGGPGTGEEGVQS